MSFYRVPGNFGVVLSSAGLRSFSFVEAPTPPLGGLTSALTAGYVDSSGNRQWVSVVDNVTTISGTAPLFVEFFGGDSVSEQSDSNTTDEAFWNLGYLMNYGEGLGGNWSLSGRPRDTDRGFPVFAHTYTTAGTHSARLTCRDSAGNQAFIRVNVVVSAPGAGVDMTTGVIPAFASSTVYNAPAGGTWGDITSQLNGLHNVIIRKTGAGADPVFGSVSLDGRNEPTSAITRTRGVRFLNCDVASVTWGNVGFDYCAFVGGRVRQVAPAPMEYFRDQIAVLSMPDLQASNIRMVRGLMLQDTGQMGDENGDAYVLIGEMRGLHLKNVNSVKGTSTNHNIRGMFAYSSFRHMRLNNTASSVSYFKFQGWACTGGVNLPTLKGTPDPWRDDEMVIDSVTRRPLGLPCTRVAVVDCQLGASGGVTPVANAGFGPQNNDLEPAEGAELAGFEYCNWIQTSTWYSMDFTGRHIGRRDCFLNLGAGDAVGVTAGVSHPNRTPDGWGGPYYTTGTRPEVVA
jgi:hypothetical protein